MGASGTPPPGAGLQLRSAPFELVPHRRRSATNFRNPTPTRSSTGSAQHLPGSKIGAREELSTMCSWRELLSPHSASIPQAAQ